MKAHRALAPFIRFICGMKVTGLENIPATGGALLCPNHIAARDVVMIAAACNRPIRFVAKKELFSIPILGRLINFFGAIKLDRNGTDLTAIRKSIEVVGDGGLVCIFPQGHRNPGVDPAKTPIKNGAGMISYRAKCGIIPVCIKTKKNKYALFRKLEIEFGKKIEFEELGFVDGGNAEYKAATEFAFAKVIEMGDFSGLPAPKN